MGNPLAYGRVYKHLLKWCVLKLAFSWPLYWLPNDHLKYNCMQLYEMTI
jgi:hypothetical protein